MQVHAVMVETQNTSIGQVIDQQRVDLPLKARKVTDLIYLVDRRRAPSRRSGGDRQRAPRNERGSLQMLALMQDDGTRGNGRPEYRYSWFGWAMEFASTGTAIAQAATICDAAQFIVSDEPVENSLYFSSNSMSSTRVLRRYESHASYQVLASRIP